MNWNKFVFCKKCKTPFMCEDEDIDVYFNADTEETKRFVVCPECWEYNKVEVEIDEQDRKKEIS